MVINPGQPAFIERVGRVNLHRPLRRPDSLCIFLGHRQRAGQEILHQGRAVGEQLIVRDFSQDFGRTGVLVIAEQAKPPRQEHLSLFLRVLSGLRGKKLFRRVVLFPLHRQQTSGKYGSWRPSVRWFLEEAAGLAEDLAEQLLVAGDRFRGFA